MPGYISEGIRYFRIARNHINLLGDDLENAFVVITFSAMYLESLINEVVFQDQLISKLYREALGQVRQTVDLNIYEEKESLTNKIVLIMDRYGVEKYEQDDEFIEISHLSTLRGFLVHLKPVAQIPSGEPERKICRAALTYLHKNVKIISDPFGRGVFWTDVLMNKDVANWALDVVLNAIRWLFEKTHDGALGNQTLMWHIQLTNQKTGN